MTKDEIKSGILDGKNIYLSTFEFVCGEYCQLFEKIFLAKDETELEKAVDDYLRGYYLSPDETEIDDGDYCYFGGEVAIRNHGWQKIDAFEQLVNELM